MNAIENNDVLKKVDEEINNDEPDGLNRDNFLKKIS